eukprot:scaffold10.g2389.t1
MLTTGAGISCSLWTKEAKAAYEAALLAIARATGSVADVTSLCRQLNGTPTAAPPGATRRDLLVASAATTLEIVHLLKLYGPLSAAVCDGAHTERRVTCRPSPPPPANAMAPAKPPPPAKNAVAPAKPPPPKSAMAPAKPPPPAKNAMVPAKPPPSAKTATVPAKPPLAKPPPPAKNAMVATGPRVYDFLGKQSEYKGKAGATLSILLAGKGAAALSLTAMLEAYAPTPGSTIMTSVTFKAAGATVVFTQSRTQPGGAYKLTAKVTANSGMVTLLAAGTATTAAQLPGLFVAAPSPTRIAAQTPAMLVAVEEGILSGKTQGYLNVIITVTGALPSPVSGVLGPSFNAPTQHAKALSAKSAIVANIGASVDN